jgi:NitT/TauT family transport system substrate-binding protein
LNPSYKGVTGEMLYNRMTTVYKGLGYADAKTPSWRLISNPLAIQNTQLTGAGNIAEGQKVFSAPTVADAETKEAIATKRVSINFRSGEFQLDENAKYIVDKEMVDIARAFSNSRIRVEGNTDNVGNPASNKALSLKRAQSVVDYMVKTYNMPRNRFVVVGNGPDNPVADNGSEDGKAKNRRTDFEIISSQ